jgi:hypothetical protein
MKKMTVFMSLLFFLTVVFVGAQNAPDLKTASKMAQINAKVLKKEGVTKVMIIEFIGDFITSKETEPSAMDRRWGSSALFKRTQEITIGSDYYETLTNKVFDIVAGIFEENGIEVLDKNILIENPDYIALGLKEERKTRSYSGGLTKKSVTTEGIKRSASGMGFFSETLKIGAIIKINEMIPKIAHDNGCQASLTVKFKYGMGKKNEPVLEYINIDMKYKLDEVNAGRGTTTFVFKAEGPLFTTTKGIQGSTDFILDKGEVDLEKYEQNMLDMAATMAGAYKVLLRDALSE